jgi:hypothetical protein
MARRASPPNLTLTAFVGRPVQDVGRLLASDPQTVISGAHHGGDERVVVNLEVPLGKEGSVSRAAAVTLGVSAWEEEHLRLPITVSALERERWFPTFTGVLEADEVGVGDTRLRLSGTYELPLGALGRVSGRAGADKLAQASLYSLFVSIVTGAERELRSMAPEWRPAAAPEILRQKDDHPLDA